MLLFNSLLWGLLVYICLTVVWYFFSFSLKKIEIIRTINKNLKISFKKKFFFD